MSSIRTAIVIGFVSVFIAACAMDDPMDDEQEIPTEEREQNDHEDENMIDRDPNNENKLPDVEREDDLPGTDETDDLEEEHKE